MKPKKENQFELIDGVLDFLETQLSIMIKPVNKAHSPCETLIEILEEEIPNGN